MRTDSLPALDRLAIEAGALDAETVQRLKVIAESPLAAPSYRIRARAALRRHHEAVAGAAGDAAIAADLAARIAAGDRLGWRDRAMAVRLGLIRPNRD